MQPNPRKAGYRQREWCEIAGISRAKLYTLPLNLKPKSVLVVGVRMITESPESYYARISALQARAGGDD